MDNTERLIKINFCPCIWFGAGCCTYLDYNNRRYYEFLIYFPLIIITIVPQYKSINAAHQKFRRTYNE